MMDDKQMDKAAYLQKVIDSFTHPFYVIDIENYKIKFANKACGFGVLTEDMTCHLMTHKSVVPCGGAHICPIDEIRKEQKSVKTEHIHYNKEGEKRIMEVHGDPVFDDDGKLIMMIEYAFDITDMKESEAGLKNKIAEIEKFNKLMLDREERIMGLKKEINDLLKSIGKSPKYG
ncbi:PAS domain S-box protein [bacterium]|nr:MAG: PAS domain S-box protein [bacterium]